MTKYWRLKGVGSSSLHLLSVSNCFFLFSLGNGTAGWARYTGWLCKLCTKHNIKTHLLISISDCVCRLPFHVLHWAGMYSEDWPVTCNKWHCSTLCIINSIPSACLLDLVVQLDDLLYQVTYRTHNKIKLSYASTWAPPAVGVWAWEAWDDKTWVNTCNRCCVRLGFPHCIWREVERCAPADCPQRTQLHYGWNRLVVVVGSNALIWKRSRDVCMQIVLKGLNCTMGEAG